MKISQYIAAGSQFDGLAQNAAFSDGGLFQIPFSGTDLVCARIRKLMFKTPGALTSFTWAQQLWSSGHLLYDNVLAALNQGKTLTGATSGDTGVIVRNDVATSKLYLGDLTGPFQNDEQITDDGGGDALANGTVTFDTVTIDTGAATDTDYELAFEGDAGLLDNDGNAAVAGTPVPVIFVSVGLTEEAVAEVMYDYVVMNQNQFNG